MRITKTNVAVSDGREVSFQQICAENSGNPAIVVEVPGARYCFLSPEFLGLFGSRDRVKVCGRFLDPDWGSAGVPALAMDGSQAFGHEQISEGCCEYRQQRETGQTVDEVLADIEAAFDYRRSVTVTVHACAPTKKWSKK
jgi:hypothetical protein